MPPPPPPLSGAVGASSSRKVDGGAEGDSGSVLGAGEGCRCDSGWSGTNCGSPSAAAVGVVSTKVVS